MNLSPLCYGPPRDPETRLPKERRCYELLSRLEIPYARVDHDAAMTMEACAQVDQVLGTKMCKNLFLCNRQKTMFFLLLMPAEKLFRTSEVSKKVGASRLSFADAADMERYLDITPGSLSLLGLMKDTAGAVQLLVDEDILKEDFIGIHPCVNTSSLRLSTADAFGRLLKEMSHSLKILSLGSEPS